MSVNIQFTADIGAIAFSEQAHCQFRTTRTHQSGDSHYFAFSDIEVNVIHYLTVGIQRMMYRPVFYLHPDLSDVRLSLRETVGDFSSYHSFDNTALGNIVFSLHQCLDGRTVTDDRDLIRHIRDLIQFMGYDDGCHSLFLQFQHQIQQCFGVCLI